MDETELRTHFSRYKEVRIAGPCCEGILNERLCSTACLFEEEDGPFNTRFRDLEAITYFYDFTGASSPGPDSHDPGDTLVYTARGANDRSVGSMLEDLLGRGKRVTHIVRCREEYGGDTHYSVWREYLDAEIYEVERK